MEKTKNKKFFKNKIEMFITVLVFVLCIIGFIYFGKMDYSKNKPTHNEQMNIEHPEVDIDNIFEYINVTQANNYIKNKKVIILFGTSNQWTGHYAKILNQVAREVGIDKIYFYDFEQDRKDGNATYQNIVEQLNNYALHLDDNTLDLYSPTLLVINDGVVVLFDDESSYRHGSMSPDEYWNDYNTNLKINELKVILSDYKG